MSNGPLAYGELAALIKSCAGISIDPDAMTAHPETPFKDYGLDSLGLIGVVAALERRFEIPLGTDAEKAKSPHELVEFVNAQLTSGV